MEINADKVSFGSIIVKKIYGRTENLQKKCLKRAEINFCIHAQRAYELKAIQTDKLNHRLSG